MTTRPEGYSPSRPIGDDVEDGLVLTVMEAFFEGRACAFCGCQVYGTRPDGRGEIVHDTVIYPMPDGTRVTVQLLCTVCRPGRVSVCWQRRGWDEVAGELRP